MTPDQTATVLAKCAAVDLRTIGRADVLAWHELVGHLEYTDALEAVKRWYGNHRERIMPSDLLAEAKALRLERAEKEHHPVLALPSKFESDLARDARISRGMSTVKDVMREIQARIDARNRDSAVPLTPEEEIRQRALDRARDERKAQKGNQ